MGTGWKLILKGLDCAYVYDIKCLSCVFCFSEPPCLHRLRSNLPALLIRGETRVMPGAYTPSCDEDGFYLPRQCRVTDRQGTKECWCVDRHGSKIEGLLDCGRYSEKCG